MADERTFDSPADNGERPGWVTLSTGQRTFRYASEDDMICAATTAPDRTES